ncbi:MAG: preprotein translocase subunit YajC [Candidatus Cloacimonetes bacterium]|nr:preprotein translocase subunit YajC [Candidatus Cloacimonadota bacterium]
MYYVLLQAGTEAQPNPFISFLPFVFLILILYFLIIRPQQKRQKDHQRLLDDLKINDVVITSGGIIGKITNFRKEKDTVILKIDDTNNTKIEVRRVAIAGIWQEPTITNEPVE